MINLGHLPPTCRSLVDYLSALMFMFIYLKSGKSMCAMLGGINIKTIHKRIEPYVDALFELNYDVVSDASLFYFNTTHFLTCHQQICFEDRFEGDTGNDCLMSVDGTDFRIAASYKKSLYSYKFKKSALRYEVGICIKTGKICWWNGPFLPGDENDDMIFQQGLAQELGPGERVETDKGYVGSAPLWTRVPGGMEEPERRGMTNDYSIGTYWRLRTVTTLRGTKFILVPLLV